MLQTTMFYSQNPEKHYTMSKLLVFGPSSFPLLTTKSGAVVMAAGWSSSLTSSSSPTRP